eukprot:4374224-Pyramimonas_sp.AAC.1
MNCQKYVATLSAPSRPVGLAEGHGRPQGESCDHGGATEIAASTVNRGAQDWRFLGRRRSPDFAHDGALVVAGA